MFILEKLRIFFPYINSHKLGFSHVCARYFKISENIDKTYTYTLISGVLEDLKLLKQHKLTIFWFWGSSHPFFCVSRRPPFCDFLQVFCDILNYFHKLHRNWNLCDYSCGTKILKLCNGKYDNNFKRKNQVFFFYT